MNVRGRRFAVDKANGKLAGVCAGIGDRLGIDPTIVRIAFVLGAVIGSTLLVLIIYGVLAYVGQDQSGFRRKPAPALKGRASAEETRERIRDIDRRMQEIETYVASPNNRLAREIDELR